MRDMHGKAVSEQGRPKQWPLPTHTLARPPTAPTHTAHLVAVGCGHKERFGPSSEPPAPPPPPAPPWLGRWRGGEPSPCCPAGTLQHVWQGRREGEGQGRGWGGKRVLAGRAGGRAGPQTTNMHLRCMHACMQSTRQLAGGGQLACCQPAATSRQSHWRPVRS